MAQAQCNRTAADSRRFHCRWPGDSLCICEGIRVAHCEANVAECVENSLHYRPASTDRVTVAEPSRLPLRSGRWAA